MRTGMLALTTVGMLAGGSLAACGDDSGDAGGDSDKPKVGVILPDSATSNRWEQADRKYLKAAFDAAGVDSDIQNAQGDKNAFQTLADQMITSVDVLMIVNLDSGTGKAVLDRAKAAGVATIDYDRLTIEGGAQYYVSFDNMEVGKLQGEGLAKCLTDMRIRKPVVAELNGAPSDNNATLFAQGYDSVLSPKYASGEYVKGPNESVPEWDNATGGAIFERMLASTKGKIDAVIAANDGLGNAVISVLKKNKLNGKVPVTGQDATVEGLQNILAGDQCMTVYKAVKEQADAAAQLAVSLAKGEKKPLTQSVKDPRSGKAVPSVLLTPKAIFKDSVKDVVTDGFVSKEELCKGTFAELCSENGIN